MNNPQEKMSGEQPPQTNTSLTLTPIARVLPIIIGMSIGIGFGPGIYKAIGESMGWGSYSIATFCVGTLVISVIGGSIGGISAMVLNLFGKVVKV